MTQLAEPEGIQSREQPLRRLSSVLGDSELERVAVCQI